MKWMLFSLLTLGAGLNQPENEKEASAPDMGVEEYSVIKVQGNILYSRDQKPMKTGDRFKSNEKLDFKSKGARAAVISKTKGRLVLERGGSSTNKLIPAMSNISTRSGAIVNALDLKKMFSDKLLVLDTMAVQVNAELFPQNDTSFFHISYAYNGETIHKKLPFEGESLLIAQNNLMAVDGKPIDGEGISGMTLWYRSGSDKKSKKISDFELVFPDTDELKTELEVLKSSLDKGFESSKKTDEILAYLEQFYAKAQKENVQSWLEKNIEL